MPTALSGRPSRFLNAICPPVDGHFDVSGAIGKAGFLHVTKDLGMKEPYQGMVQLVTSEIGEDIAHYFSTSEQTPTSIALGVLLDRSAHIAASGGYFIQAMPDCDEKVLASLEQPSGQSATYFLADPRGLIAHRVGPNRFLTTVISNCKTPLILNLSAIAAAAMSWPCSAGFPGEELEALSQREEDTEITCEYCKTNYRFTPAELSHIAQGKNAAQ